MDKKVRHVIPPLPNKFCEAVKQIIPSFSLPLISKHPHSAWHIEFLQQCRCLSWCSRLQHHVDLQVHTNVSVKHNASIFILEDEGSMFPQNVGIYLQWNTHLRFKVRFKVHKHNLSTPWSTNQYMRLYEVVVAWEEATLVISNTENGYTYILQLQTWWWGTVDTVFMWTLNQGPDSIHRPKLYSLNGVIS
jgi:hypothetical protein